MEKLVENLAKIHKNALKFIDQWAKPENFQMINPIKLQITFKSEFNIRLQANKSKFYIIQGGYEHGGHGGHGGGYEHGGHGGHGGYEHGGHGGGHGGYEHGGHGGHGGYEQGGHGGHGGHGHSHY